VWAASGRACFGPATCATSALSPRSCLLLSPVRLSAAAGGLPSPSLRPSYRLLFSLGDRHDISRHMPARRVMPLPLLCCCWRAGGGRHSYAGRTWAERRGWWRRLDCVSANALGGNRATLPSCLLLLFALSSILLLHLLLCVSRISGRRAEVAAYGSKRTGTFRHGEAYPPLPACPYTWPSGAGATFSRISASLQERRLIRLLLRRWNHRQHISSLPPVAAGRAGTGLKPPPLRLFYALHCWRRLSSNMRWRTLAERGWWRHYSRGFAFHDKRTFLRE